MSELTAKENNSLLGEILGRISFDDRVDTQPDIKTSEAMILIDVASS